jgi:hypothetical protein
MSVMFAAIAVLSFAVDQTVTLSDAGGDGRDRLHPPGRAGAFAAFSPVRLIQSLIDPTFDRSDHPE